MEINTHFSPLAYPRDCQKTLYPGFHSVVSGKRYYCPSQGRFIGRDSKEEKGGLNLYGFCGNNAINRWDYLGNSWENYDPGNPRHTALGIQYEPGQLIWIDDDPFDNTSVRGGGIGIQMPGINFAAPFGVKGGSTTAPDKYEVGRQIEIKPWYGDKNRDASLEAAAKVAALYGQLASMKNPDGSSTEIQRMITAINASDYSTTIYAVSDPLSMDQTNGRNKGPRGEPEQTGSIIFLKPDRIYQTPGTGPNGEVIWTNQLSNLAHENAHAYWNITVGNDGVWHSTDEFEAIRVGNQIRSLVGLPLEAKQGNIDIPEYDKYVIRPKD